MVQGDGFLMTTDANSQAKFKDMLPSKKVCKFVGTIDDDSDCEHAIVAVNLFLRFTHGAKGSILENEADVRHAKVLVESLESRTGNSIATCRLARAFTELSAVLTPPILEGGRTS